MKIKRYKKKRGGSTCSACGFEGAGVWINEDLAAITYTKVELCSKCDSEEREALFPFFVEARKKTNFRRLKGMSGNPFHQTDPGIGHAAWSNINAEVTQVTSALSRSF